MRLPLWNNFFVILKNPTWIITDNDSIINIPEKIDKVKMLLNSPVIIDLRNIYKPTTMNELGFKYVSIGRGGI